VKTIERLHLITRKIGSGGGSADGLDQFDAVAEGVAEFEAVEVGEGDGFEDLCSGGLKALSPTRKVGDLVGEVGLRGAAIDAVFDANVELELARDKPEAASSLQGAWLFDFGHAEDVAIEGAGGLFLAGGDGDLGVVEAEDLRNFMHPSC
jgi:hypothetical protein